MVDTSAHLRLPSGPIQLQTEMLMSGVLARTPLMWINSWCFARYQLSPNGLARLFLGRNEKEISSKSTSVKNKGQAVLQIN